MAALEVAQSVRSGATVDRALRSATESVDRLCRRRHPNGVPAFVPMIDTRYFNYPSRQPAYAWSLDLDADTLAGAPTAVTAGGVALTLADLLAEPVNSGPPYTRLETRLGGASSYTAAPASWQRAIAITGPFGYRDASALAGAAAEAIDGSETAIDVTDSVAIGVGDLVKCDNERMVVTGKRWLATGQTVTTDLGATRGEVAVAVSSGAAFVEGESVLIDSEMMVIEAIAGNALTVKRSTAGTVLAAHASTAAVYAPRTLVVERGAYGTTAASHDTAATLTRWVPPAMAEELCLAEALCTYLQVGTAYVRTIGAGDNVRNASGAGLDDVRERCFMAHGRKFLHRAVR